MTSDWRKNSFTWGKRLTLVLLILGGAIYGVLSLAERSKDSLRKGLEDYVRKQTGQYAQITDMISADLIPTTAFKMKGISVRSAEDYEKTLLHIDQAYISMSFFGMMIGSGKYKGFEFKGVQTASGYPFPKKSDLNFAGISDPAPEASPANFLIDGRYNDLPLLFTAEMKRDLKEDGPVYSFAHNFPVTFKLGTNEGNGLYYRTFSAVGVKDGLIKRDGAELQFAFEIVERDPLRIKAKLGLGESRFNVELTESGKTMSLKIVPENPQDKALPELEKHLKALRKDIGYTENDLPITIDQASSAPSPTKDNEEE